jgi:hypothetical protein
MGLPNLALALCAYHPTGALPEARMMEVGEGQALGKSQLWEAGSGLFSM